VSERSSAPETQSAITRWIGGHQAFHVYLVSMNTAIARATASLPAADDDGLCAALAALTTLYQAAAATMHYASDFPATGYESAVRPSMSPPSLSPGFSGKLNRDHASMLTGLATLGASLRVAYGQDTATWPLAVERGWNDVDRARAASLANHFKICRRFVAEEPSLLKSASQYAEGRPRR
jgi:hypothetical protein